MRLLSVERTRRGECKPADFVNLSERTTRMKPAILSFAAGLLVGGAAVWMLKRPSAPGPGGSPAVPGPEGVPSRVVVAAEPSSPPAASTPDGAADAAAPPPPDAGAGASSGPGASIRIGGGEIDLGKAIRESQERQAAAQVEARLLKLRSTIALTPDQEEAIRGFLGEQMREGIGAIATVVSGIGTGDGADQVFEFATGGMTAREEAFESFMRELLDEDQQAGFDAFLERELANRIEARANADLAHLQSVVSLDPTQKEAAFAAFAEIAAENEAAGRPLAIGTGRLREALEPVLTPEQMEVWSGQATTGFGFAPGAVSVGGVPGGAAISIRVNSLGADGVAVPPVPAPGPAASGAAGE